MCGGLVLSRSAHAAGSDLLKIGLIGCGGRGTGALLNALAADAHTKVHALSDWIAKRVRTTKQAAVENFGKDRVDVPEERCFAGLDSYKNVLASGIDVVLIALPTYFHPHYVKAAIDAGIHVFCEKTHAVDPPGVRMILDASETAKKKNLALVSGLAWRYDTGAIETMKRIHDGAIGEIIAIEETCNCGGLRCLPREPGQTEMEYQLQDWFDFFWLSCDLPGLNLVHHVDKASWAMKETVPVSCWGMGGRQTRTDPRFGDAWDHHATVFQYENGVRMFAYCRQQDGTFPDVSDRFYGTKGRCDLLQYRIDGENPWRFEQGHSNRFELEHVALFRSIRDGSPLNNGLYMAQSSLLGVMATWASFTGNVITWDRAFHSNAVLGPADPDTITFQTQPPTVPGQDGHYPLPRPGVTAFPV